jgi:hypothetical protein
MNDLRTAKDLRAAADYLRTHGWCRFDYGYDGGPACLTGAIVIVSSGGMDLKLGLQGDAYRVMKEQGFTTRWNDCAGRTVEQVLEGLESTALALEVRALSRETQASLEEVVTMGGH